MASLNLDFVLSAVSGKALSQHQKQFSGVGTDTRVSLQGQLFIALKGEAFDAHKFLAAAVKQQAAGLLLHDESMLSKEILNAVTVIKVDDTLKALQDLARAYRRQGSAKIIGIAGSNGKTTSKEFCAALLGSVGRVHYSKGSFNNHWGVPFTLLSQPSTAQFSVVEMGMNHAQELALLAKIAEPDICVCTYVGIEHIEHFGSLQKIADAEEEIYLHSPTNCLRIFNLDNTYTRAMMNHSKSQFPKSRTLTFSERSSEADVCLKIKEVSMDALTVTGSIQDVAGEARVEIFGKHNVTNLMVAASVGLAAGLTPKEVWDGLKFCRTTWGRNQLLSTVGGAQILFDAYNANPDSMKALVENMSLVKCSGKKVGVFAEMRELGAQAAELHRETGRAVGLSNLDLIWFYGPHAEDFASGLRESKFKGQILTHTDFDSKTSKEIAGSLKAGDIALIKGSRGMALERFVKDAQALHFDEKH